MRVLFITAWYPARSSPLNGIYVREHAKAVQLFNDVAVLHIGGSDAGLKRLWVMDEETDNDLNEGILTYRIWHRLLSIPMATYFVHLLSVYWAFRCIVAKGFRPHIIHAHVYEAAVSAVIIGRIHRIPVVVTEHSSKFPSRALTRREQWKVRFAYRFSGLVIPVSQFLQRAIQKYKVKCRFIVVRNVVDPKIFYPGSGTKSKRKIRQLLVVGLFRSSQVKGLPYLFDALVMLRKTRSDWCLSVVGDGPLRQEYERCVERLRLSDKVSFCGLRTKSEVADYMRQADLLIVSSVLETSSVVAAEALLSGVPVLATRCGGPEEFVNERVGLTVLPRDSKDLCEGISYVLDHLERFSSGDIAKYGVGLFSPPAVGQRLQQIYSACLKR